MKIVSLFSLTLLLLLLSLLFTNDVHCYKYTNLTVVSNDIKVPHGQSYHKLVDSKYFGMWTVLLKTTFHGNYYFFAKDQYEKFQKETEKKEAIALHKELDVPSNTTLFLQLGQSGKSLLRTFPNNETIYFVAENINLLSQDGEIESLSSSIQFLPAGWMIFLFVVIGLVMTAVFLIFLVAAPLLLCIGVGRVIEKVASSRLSKQDESYVSI